jgi:hypothetical protein
MPDKKTDALVTSIMEGLLQCDEVKLFCTSDGNNAINIVSYQRALELIKTVDYIFVMHGKNAGNYSLLEYVDWNKVVIFDGSEWSFNYRPINNKGSIEQLINHDWIRNARVYFKRECYPSHIELGARPLQFAVTKSEFGNFNEEKTIDVLCAFPHIDHHWPDHEALSYRRIAMNACEELQDEGYKIVIDTVPDYLRTVNQTWITVDAYGGGEFNRRTKQIIANKSALLAKKYQIRLHDLVEGEHYHAWESAQELKKKIRQMLSDKVRLQQFITKSYEHICDRHTSAATARYILKEIQQ